MHLGELVGVAGACVLLANGALAQCLHYDGGVGYPTAAAGLMMATGDVDGDGDVDVAVALGTAGVLVMTNDGAGGFTTAPLYTGPERIGDVSIADVNGDGDLDIVGSTSNGPYTFMNQGGGVFAPIVVYTGQIAGLIKAVDLDGDKDIDLIGVQRAAGSVIHIRTWMNDGSGAFVPGESTLVNDGPLQSGLLEMDVADFENDGDIDVALCIEHAEPPIFILRNNGAGVMSAPERYASGFNAVHLAVGDVTGDGLADVLTVDVQIPGGAKLRVLANEGDGFAYLPQQSISLYAHGLMLTDFDGDGDVDLGYAGGFPPFAAVWLNGGSGAFSGGASINALPDPHSMVAADFDGDGDVDVAVMSYDFIPDESFFVSVYKNVGTLQITDQPDDVNVCEGAGAVLSVQASSTTTATYQWYKGDAALSDGVTKSGMVVSGAGTAGLVLSNISAKDAGEYSVVITNECTSAHSTIATLGVGGECCRTDVNGDGVVNSTDVSDFINVWFGDQLEGTLNADFNVDGVSNSTDVSDFINVWFEESAVGCG